MVEHEHEARARERRRTAHGAGVDGDGGIVVLARAASALGLALHRARAARRPPERGTGGRCAASAPHLTVQGSGQGSGTPDVLTAVFGFSTTASSSTAALSQNNAKVAPGAAGPGGQRGGQA